MAENGKFVERRKRRPHHDWNIWYTVWRSLMDEMVSELKELKTFRARHGKGAPERQHRAAVLRGKVRMLLRVRRLVRAGARVDADLDRAFDNLAVVPEAKIQEQDQTETGLGMEH